MNDKRGPRFIKEIQNFPFTKVNTMTRFDAALTYAEYGLSVFPCSWVIDGRCSCKDQNRCKNMGKHPLFEEKTLKHGVKNATTDLEMIKQWWSRWPEANIGIATGEMSGIDVLDVDKGKGGLDSLRIVLQSREIERTLTAVTPGGGCHCYYLHNTNVHISNKTGFKKGFDWKTTGGYVIAAPSSHRNGVVYQWCIDKSFYKIQPSPDWLIEELTTPETEQVDSKTAFTALDVANAHGLLGQTDKGEETCFLCPCHDDNRPSLAINRQKDCWMCGPCQQSGNKWGLVAFILKGEANYPKYRREVSEWLVKNGLLNQSKKSEGTTDAAAFQLKKSYRYEQADGSLCYYVERYERIVNGQKEKTFRMKPSGSPKIIYRLPEVLQAQLVFIPEGEKDCDTLKSIFPDPECAATTNPFGAGKWLPEFANYFHKGQNVIIIPDNDEPGGKHALEIAHSIYNVVNSVKILNLPGLDEGGDVTDWFAGASQDATSTFIALCKSAKPWTPPQTELDVSTVKDWPCEPLSWVIDGIIARGTLCLLAADSQTGKSLLLQNMCPHLLLGGKLFGKFDINPVRKILYLCLEDPPRRVKERLLDMQSDFNRSISLKEYWNTDALTKIGKDRLIFNFDSSFSLDRDLDWLKQKIEKENIDLLIIDTYQKATPGLNSFDDQKQSIILHALSNLTRKTGVTIIVADHLRKGTNFGNRKRQISKSEIKGTGAKVQNADAVILLAESRHTETGNRLLAWESSSKDGPPQSFLLEVSAIGTRGEKFKFYEDLSVEAKEEKAEESRQKILRATTEWSELREIVTRTGVSLSTVKRRIKDLLKSGKMNEKGKKPKSYRATDQKSQ